MSDNKLRQQIIRLAHAKPELRDDLLPFLGPSRLVSASRDSIVKINLGEVLKRYPQPSLRNPQDIKLMVSLRKGDKVLVKARGIPDRVVTVMGNPKTVKGDPENGHPQVTSVPVRYEIPGRRILKGRENGFLEFQDEIRGRTRDGKYVGPWDLNPFLRYYPHTKNPENSAGAIVTSLKRSR